MSKHRQNVFFFTVIIVTDVMVPTNTVHLALACSLAHLYFRSLRPPSVKERGLSNYQYHVVG